jgi:polyisoprenoid-binding protein YceI
MYGGALAAGLLAVLSLARPAPAQANVAGHWEVREGAVAYEVSHALHGAVGRSAAVQGDAHCERAACTFRFSVPLASFDSGDEDRDRDMQAVTLASEHPHVVVEGRGELVDGAAARLHLRVTWAGRQVELEPLRMGIERSWRRLRVKGNFALSLTAFGIQRPALLGLPISDRVRIYVDLTLAPA